MSFVGIDVSDNNSGIHWSYLYHHGIRFAMLKCTEGLTFVDRSYIPHRAAANSLGIPIGGYHFFHPTHNGKEQATFLLEHLKIRRGDILPAIDVEVSDGQTIATILGRLGEMIQELHRRLGVCPVVYTSPGYWHGIGDPKQFGKTHLWTAEWDVKKPELYGDWKLWTIWQYKSTNLDYNVAHEFPPRWKPIVRRKPKPPAKPKKVNLCQ